MVYCFYCNEERTIVQSIYLIRLKDDTHLAQRYLAIDYEGEGMWTSIQQATVFTDEPTGAYGLRENEEWVEFQEVVRS